ncbi:MAG: hypothetical protein WC979_02225 [Candidatus Pacearchaeota archaeon]|jgi:hypothetical protein|nr:hypothetical protein [Clostridia bacterium]
MSDSMAYSFIDINYTDEKKKERITCKCGWTGICETSEVVYVNTIRMTSGWAGLQFNCPTCKNEIKKMIVVMS